jgi:(4S)-4-hydroxy-5-phosphonooxypentane-2,3-dione isomerase
MTHLAIMGRVDVASERLEDVLGSHKAYRDRCLHDEPGTLKFELLRPRGDNAAILLYELYEDGAAFETHRDGASIARFRKEVAELNVKITATRCTPVA